jgi:hypothetical protein
LLAEIVPLVGTAPLVDAVGTYVPFLYNSLKETDPEPVSLILVLNSLKEIDPDEVTGLVTSCTVIFLTSGF